MLQRSNADPAAALAPGAFLRLLQLASPALPVGGFSYSEGLEAAVEAGLVHDAPSATRWLTDQLLLGLARSELPVVAKALDAWATGDDATLQRLDDWVSATRDSAETRLQTEQMGRSMAQWLRQQPSVGVGAPAKDPSASLERPPTWPLAFACAAAATGAPKREAMLAFAFGWAENMVQAALKAVPLGQNAGQQVLAALIVALPPVVEQATVLADEARQAHMPMLAILSARHETQYSRLFRS